MKDYLIFIPNLISITRIILVYPILINFYNGHFFWSLSFFILASLSDALDGYLARTFNWQTELGKILDPIADKFLLIGMVLIFSCLCVGVSVVRVGPVGPSRVAVASVTVIVDLRTRGS